MISFLCNFALEKNFWLRSFFSRSVAAQETSNVKSPQVSFDIDIAQVLLQLEKWHSSRHQSSLLSHSWNVIFAGLKLTISLLLLFHVKFCSLCLITTFSICFAAWSIRCYRARTCACAGSWSLAATNHLRTKVPPAGLVVESGPKLFFFFFLIFERSSIFSFCVSLMRSLNSLYY